MSGRVDEQYKENISVMKCCCEKQIQRANEQIQELEEKDKRAKERIEDLEEVGKLCIIGLTVLCDPVP